MTKQFITVSLILDALKNERASGRATMSDAPRFLDWQEGYQVKPKNGGDTFVIKSIKSGVMSYDTSVLLVGADDPGETRTLRSTTLQSGYAFVSRGDVADPSAKSKTTKPMTIATDCIRSFSPRKHGAAGTRIVLKDGVSYPALEEHEAILAQIGETAPTA